MPSKYLWIKIRMEKERREGEVDEEMGGGTDEGPLRGVCVCGYCGSSISSF
jgi:hypothetical protein